MLWRRGRWAIWVALVAGASIVLVVHSQRSHAAAACNKMSLREGPLVSEATGQHTAAFVLTNRGRAACTLHGYPRVVLLTGDRRTLPFEYSHDGDQMIRKRRPETVHVAAGGRAFFAINKYRCDFHAEAGARSIRVLLPGERHWLEHTLGRYPSLDYCPAEAPSRTIAVSPIVTERRYSLGG